MKWLLLIMLAAPLSGLRTAEQALAEPSGAQFDVVENGVQFGQIALAGGN